MIIVCIFLTLLVATSAATNSTCGASQYYNANLSICLSCPAGCSACCDEAVCSGCITGTPLITQDTLWPRQVGHVCSVPSTVTPATRTIHALPAQTTRILWMGCVWDVLLDAVHVQTQIAVRSVVMGFMLFRQPYVRLVQLVARPVPLQPPTAARHVWVGIISITIFARHVHHHVETVLLEGVPLACRDFSSREVAVFPALLTVSPVRMPPPVVSVHQAQSYHRVPVWHVLPTAIHASILLSARFVMPIMQ
jgi:hypothetical protein